MLTHVYAGHSHTAAVEVGGALWVWGWGGADEEVEEDVGVALEIGRASCRERVYTSV